MQQDSTNTEVKDTGKSWQKKRVVVPIDLDWRKKYYRKVYQKRAIAFVLDFFTTSAIASIPVLIFFPASIEKSMLPGILIQILFFIVLSAIMESSKWQATIGKLIMRIQITGENGNPISFFRSLVRNFFKILFGYSYFLIIPLVIQIYRFEKTKRLFHDEISDTIIVERMA